MQIILDTLAFQVCPVPHGSPISFALCLAFKSFELMVNPGVYMKELTGLSAGSDETLGHFFTGGNGR